MKPPPFPLPPGKGIAVLIAISLIEGAVVLHVLAGVGALVTGLPLAMIAAAAALKSGVILGLLTPPRRNPAPCPPAAQTRPLGKDSVIHHYRQHWGLTEAECDVAIFVVKGLSNSEIATLRNCTLTTVKSQLGSVYQKTGLRGRYQLIAFVTDEVCADHSDAPAPPAPHPMRPGPARQHKTGWAIARLWRVPPVRMPRSRTLALRNLSR